MEQARRALKINPDRVASLRIVTTNYLVATTRDADGWVIEEPVAARGDKGAIERVLQRLAELPRGEVITAEEREADGLDLEDYGLVDPVAEITFREGEQVRTLYLGGTAPVGGAVYVMESNRTDVVAIKAPVWDYLPGAPSDLRSRRLVHLAPLRVQRIDIRRPAGFMQLARDAEGAWWIEQPVAGRADDGMVGDLLDMLLRVEVQRFVADGVEDLAPYGLAEPMVEITLWTGPDDEPLTIGLGGPLEGGTDLIHAMATDAAAVVAVGRHTLFETGIEPNLLRDRRLVQFDPAEVAYVRMTEGDMVLAFEKDDAGSWALTRPRSRKAADDLVWAMIADWNRATVAAFVADGVTNAADYGLEPPQLSLVFASEPLPNGTSTVDEAPAPDPDLLVRIDVTRTNGGPVRVRLNEGDAIVEVDPEVMGRVRADPLMYYDRTVVSVLPDDVRSITVNNGSRQTVVRDDSGLFVPGPGHTGTVVNVVVTNILAAVRSLEAVLYAVENPASLASFGLEDPAASLTLGLTGEAGISKALLFGGDVEPGCVYAMIRGQDSVFILTRNLRDRLVSDLLVTASPTDEEEPIDSAPSPSP
jgi:hypothetical protein